MAKRWIGHACLREMIEFEAGHPSIPDGDSNYALSLGRFCKWKAIRNENKVHIK